MSVKAAIMADTGVLKKWGDEEKELHKEFEVRQRLVHERLCDNIDTSGACLELRNMVTGANKYLAKVGEPNVRLLRIVGEYVTKIFKIFGCIEGDNPLGFP